MCLWHFFDDFKERQVHSQAHFVSPAAEPALKENDTFSEPHLLRKCSCPPGQGQRLVRNLSKHHPGQFW